MNDAKPNYSIITWNNDGPLKDWSTVRSASIHNSREKPVEHGLQDAPPPTHIIGTGDLVADVRGKYQALGLDPDNIRKNGVIAFECVMTATSAYFETGGDAERAARLNAWISASVDFARERWGEERIASLVLHEDEKTPHAHLVVVPAEHKVDKRSADPSPRWGINGRMISGPGMYEAAQDAYAEAMAPLGLVRGERGSENKHQPMAEYLARLAEHEQAAAAREREAAVAEARAAEAEAFWRTMQHRAALDGELAEERIREAERAEARAARDRAEVERERADGERQRLANIDEAARLDEMRKKLRGNADDLVAAWDDLDAERALLDEEKAEQQQLVLDARASIEDVEKIKAWLAGVFDAAKTFQAAVRSIKGQALPPAFVTAYKAAQRMKTDGQTVQHAANDQSPVTHATLAAVRQHAQGMGY